MKKKLLIMSIVLTSILNAKTMTFDETLDSYLNNNKDIKNLFINSQIRDENYKELHNSTYADIVATGKATYALEKTGIESKISYQDFYLSAKKTDLSKDDATLQVGYEKKLNEFLYNSDKGNLNKLSIQNEIAKDTDKTQKKALIKAFSDKYLELLNVENTIKAKKSLLEQKNKEYEIANIKVNSDNLSSYDLKVIKLNIEKLQVEILAAEKNRDYLIADFQSNISSNEKIELADIQEMSTFEIYSDESSIKELENNIAITKQEISEIKVSNLPQITAGVAYDLKNEDLSGSLAFTWYPIDYKGNEKVKQLTLEKLNNQLQDAKTTVELNKLKSSNTYSQDEMNLSISQKDIELSKAELEKYEIMKESGTASEYDYFTKQKELLDKEIEYLNAKNQLNMNKKLEEIYKKL